jgi:hypothetical protein
MTDEVEDYMTDKKQAAVKTLEMMLDYAMMEGAELRSPLFVMLLRLARLALLDELEDKRPRGDRMKGSKRVAEWTGMLTPDQASAL